ncbi:hypothetical protein EVAR_34467_1 [Eumeta japonica]|uniref:Uncharacterized protein n=1 Tax=Eumeta variegata TaxID=151549 RepID=A0A4C1WVQ3_EUMVA|nr:hypothetical protein EVAR_34467_1 [Eumeta japonica]
MWAGGLSLELSVSRTRSHYTPTTGNKVDIVQWVDTYDAATLPSQVALEPRRRKDGSVADLHDEWSTNA